MIAGIFKSKSKFSCHTLNNTKISTICQLLRYDPCCSLFSKSKSSHCDIIYLLLYCFKANAALNGKVGAQRKICPIAAPCYESLTLIVYYIFLMTSLTELLISLQLIDFHFFKAFFKFIEFCIGLRSDFGITKKLHWDGST